MKRRPRSIVRSLTPLLGFGIWLGATGCSGDGAEGSCRALAECGGNPVGTWNVVSKCQFEADHPYQQPSLSDLVQTPLSPTISPPQQQPTTTGDWCADLVYLPPDSTHAAGSVSRVNLWHDTALLQSGTMTFDQSGVYTVALNFSNAGSTHFTQTCLQFAGATPSCSDLATGLTDFYTNSVKGRQVTGGPAPTSGFDNIQCTVASDKGCDCSYTYSVALTDKGSWLAGGNVLTQSSEQYLYNGQRVSSTAPTAFMSLKYCQDGNQLMLTGDHGASLSQAVGLRTLTLKRM